MDAPITIRDAVADDHGTLETFMVELQAFEQTLCANRSEASETSAAHLAHLLGLVDASGGFTLIAESGGKPVGFLIGTVDSPPEGDEHIREELRRVGYVSDLFVNAGMRGHGVGRVLLGEAENRFRAMGLPSMEINFLAANEAARRVYEAFGFEPYEVLYSKPLN